MIKPVVAYALAVMTAGAAGCAGGPALKSDNVRLQAKVAELRAQARRDRRRIQDLENERRAASTAVSGSTDWDDEYGQELPVVVREPDAPAEGAPPENEPMHVAGIDEEGVDVVYVGDAARGPSVDPSVDDRRFRGARPPARPVKARRARSHDVPTDDLPESGERLPVTSGGVPTIGDPPVRQARSARPRARSRSFDDPRAEYQSYYAALRAGDHAKAVAGFRNFVDRFPDHDHADNAQYWLGEAFYDQKQFKSARAEFQKVVDNYPTGNKVPDALLKLAYCHAQLGDRRAARAALERVVRDYPTSNPASLAARKLEELGS